VQFPNKASSDFLLAGSEPDIKKLQHRQTSSQQQATFTIYRYFCCRDSASKLQQVAKVIALGIKGADPNELKVISSDPDSKYFINIKSFSQLDEIVDLIISSVCASQGKPTNPGAPLFHVAYPVLL